MTDKAKRQLEFTPEAEALSKATGDIVRGVGSVGAGGTPDLTSTTQPASIPSASTSGVRRSSSTTE